MQQVTRWFRIGTENPDPNKAGLYEVRFSWPSAPVIRMSWDGAEWKRVGMFKPSHSWGDMWRGLSEKPA